MWSEVHDAGSCLKQGMKFFIVEANDNAGGRETGWVRFLKIPAKIIRKRFSSKS